jgi:hypothetical protein
MPEGVKVWGPIPNTRLGGVKNVDRVNEFGEEAGFWRLVSDVVDDVRVTKGRITQRLKG